MWPIGMELRTSGHQDPVEQMGHVGGAGGGHVPLTSWTPIHWTLCELHQPNTIFVFLQCQTPCILLMIISQPKEANLTNWDHEGFICLWLPDSFDSNYNLIFPPWENLAGATLKYSFRILTDIFTRSLSWLKKTSLPLHFHRNPIFHNNSLHIFDKNNIG